MPQTAEEALPFAVLIGAILALYRMTRSQELIVTRAAGVSVWQFLTPAVAIAFAIGIFAVTIFNPAASAMEASFKQLESRLLKSQSDSMLLSSAGLWLRQSSPDGTQAVIHAARMSQTDMLLDEVSIFFFRGNDTLVRRLDAATGAARGGALAGEGRL